MADTTGYTAHARFILISPFKARRIAKIVRRKPYSEAVAILEHAPQKSATIIRKVIQSAAANALYRNKNLDEDMLYIKELQINEGPRMKRVWPRARGRADMIMKRMSHITAVVDEIAKTGE